MEICPFSCSVLRYLQWLEEVKLHLSATAELILSQWLQFLLYFEGLSTLYLSKMFDNEMFAVTLGGQGMLPRRYQSLPSGRRGRGGETVNSLRPPGHPSSQRFSYSQM